MSRILRDSIFDRVSFGFYEVVEVECIGVFMWFILL